MAESRYSRAPVFTDSVDTIIGAVHIKELLCLKEDDIEKVVRPVLFVHERMQAKTVFSALQQKRYQMAIVMDESGRTKGMVTIEDLVEEIFGEIEDEFDLPGDRQDIE
ncbi:MAG: CBS domain-containing protein [Chloroflexi bacterium]|nr:CBS domain-containing protein [Chloroflexota bacterium]